MSKKFPSWKTEEDADAWLQSADLTEYDLSGLKKVRFALARNDAAISLRLPGDLHARYKAYATAANVPMQRLIRKAMEEFLERSTKKSARKTAAKATPDATRGKRKAA